MFAPISPSGSANRAKICQLSFYSFYLWSLNFGPSLSRTRCHRIFILWQKCNFWYPQNLQLQNDGCILIFSLFNLIFKVKSKAEYILVKLRETRYTCSRNKEVHIQWRFNREIVWILNCGILWTFQRQWVTAPCHSADWILRLIFSETQGQYTQTLAYITFQKKISVSFLTIIILTIHFSRDKFQREHARCKV